MSVECGSAERYLLQRHEETLALDVGEREIQVAKVSGIQIAVEDYILQGGGDLQLSLTTEAVGTAAYTSKKALGQALNVFVVGLIGLCACHGLGEVGHLHFARRHSAGLSEADDDWRRQSAAAHASLLHANQSRLPAKPPLIHLAAAVDERLQSNTRTPPHKPAARPRSGDIRS